MTKMELEEKIKGIAEKEKFLEEAKLADTPEKMVEMLSGHGIEITVEELEKDIIPNIDIQCVGELSEEELENVDGGCICGGRIQHVIYNFFAKLLGIKPCKG